MNGNNDLEALKNELIQLRDDLHPLCNAGLPELPTALLEISDELRASMIQLGDPTNDQQGVDRATLHFIDQTFLQSMEGIDERMRTRLDLMRRAKKTGKENIYHSPFGTIEAIFPIKTGSGQVVHCLWTGPMKKGAFTEKDLETVARLTGLDQSEVAGAAEGIEGRTPEQIEETLQFYRTVALCLDGAFAHAGASDSRPSTTIGTSMQHASFSILATGFSHHFNGLLSIILGYATYILNNETMSLETTEVLEKIAEAAQRGRRLTDELLTFSGQATEQITLCKMHEVFSSVISLLEAQGRHRVRFVRKMRAKNDGIMALPGEIHQIVFNMLSCAMDSLQETGGEISVRSINVDLDQEDGSKRPHIRIDVSDSGAQATYSGTEPLLDAIMEQEIQEEEINLSNLHNTVQSLEGSLSVVTDPTGVMHIEILLPVATEQEQAATPKPVVNSGRRMTASNIWLVDDDPTFLNMCGQVLKQDGHAVEEFTDGIEMQQAWKKSEQEPDLMVFDFSMPEYNGLELREWLAEEGSTLPVVLVSGLSSSTPEIKKALGMKKTYFLQKPFSNSDLADIASVAMGETLLGE